MSHTSTPQPQPSLGELVSRISENITALVRGEIALAKAKGKRMALKLGVGAGLLAAAGVLAAYGTGFLLAAIARLIALVLPLWAGQLIVALVLLIIAGVLAGIGATRLKAASQDVPDTPARLNQDVTAATQAVRTGLEKGSAA